MNKAASQLEACTILIVPMSPVKPKDFHLITTGAEKAGSIKYSILSAGTKYT